MISQEDEEAIDDEEVSDDEEDNQEQDSSSLHEVESPPQYEDFGVQAFESKEKSKVDATTETIRPVLPQNIDIGVQAFESKGKYQVNAATDTDELV